VKKWILLAAALAGCGASEPKTAPNSVTTAKVQLADLNSTLAFAGTLTYQASADGSPYTVINQARGIYTKLPAEGDRVRCGRPLYRVNDRPVLLLCGAIPAYRDLKQGDTGKDVSQLNRNLRALGHKVTLNDRFTAETGRALAKLRVGDTLTLGEAVVLPHPVRIAKVNAQLGASARPGTPLAHATSDTPEVQVNLEPSQQSEVKRGDRALVTLPDNTTVAGIVERVGRVARAGKDDQGATIPATIRLHEPARARRFDRAPVRVEITTEGVSGALSVPVLALIGKPGGGFAVEVMRGERRELVPVELGLFDGAAGRVQVKGALKAGERVVVPSL
jgi:multidrug efflux pump subunit AcrA (membrane-fusion protein)